MQEDIAQARAGKVSLPPLSPASGPVGFGTEEAPPIFAPEKTAALISESLKQDRQKRLLKIGVIAVIILLLAGAIGFAAYRWLLPAISPQELSPPVSVTPPSEPAPAPTPEPPTPPPPAPALPSSLVQALPRTKQVDLELSSPTTDALRAALNQQAEESKNTAEARELFTRVGGEENFLDWGRAQALFLPQLGPSRGLGPRFAILVDAASRTLIIEVSSEAQAMAWLERVDAELGSAATFLFPTPPARAFSPFRSGRAISSLRFHRFATTQEGLTLDYGFAGERLIVSNNFDTFTQVAQAVAATSSNP